MKHCYPNGSSTLTGKGYVTIFAISVQHFHLTDKLNIQIKHPH